MVISPPVPLRRRVAHPSRRRPGETHQALGALLLFVTNVVAILATGTVVMAIYGVWRMRPDDTMVRASVNRSSATALIIAICCAPIVHPAEVTVQLLPRQTIDLGP
jgi:hypothetical protein